MIIMMKILLTIVYQSWNINYYYNQYYYIYTPVILKIAPIVSQEKVLLVIQRTTTEITTLYKSF